MRWPSIPHFPNSRSQEAWLFQDFLSWSGFPHPEELIERPAGPVIESREGTCGEPRNASSPNHSAARTSSPSSSIPSFIVSFNHASRPMTLHQGQDLNFMMRDAITIVRQMQSTFPKKVLWMNMRDSQKVMKNRAPEELVISQGQFKMAHWMKVSLLEVGIREQMMGKAGTDS
ncbi:MAG: hypothetical protein M1834_004801 [Cirrosporium novae-zelandiae]|nr:MAG: hypothetical protein M1834_004801 [Cirrosporium novae-zelandiae]